MADTDDDSVELRLELDTTAAREQLRKLRQGIRGTLETLNVKTSVDTTDAKDELRKLQREIARTELAIRLRSESGAAKRDIADLQSRLGTLKLQARSIDINADASQAKREIQSLKNEINSLNKAAANVRVGGLFGNQRLAGAFNAGALAGAGGGFAAGMLGGGLGARAGGGVGGFVGGAAGMLAGGPIAGAAGGVLGSTAGAIGGAALDVTAGVIGNGLQSLSQLERYEATLKSVVGDNEKANKLFSELLALNEDLPTVQLATMAEAMTKLAGAGRDTGKLKDDIPAILAAAAISSDGIAEGTNRITRAIAQMKTNGRLLGEEINQLSEVGIPASQILIDQFGMSIDEIKKQSQAGTIAIDDIIDALMQGFRDKFGGSLGAYAETLGGKLDALAKKFDEVSRKVAEPLLEPLIQSLDDLMQAADAGGLEAIAAAMQKVAEAGAAFLRFLGALSERLGEQGKLNDLSVTADAGIKSGDLSPEQLRQASAIQLAAKSLANARRDDKNAILSQQQTADFLSVESGQRVDPNAITDAQRRALTNRIDRLADVNAKTRAESDLTFDTPGLADAARSRAMRGFLDSPEVQGAFSDLGADGNLAKLNPNASQDEQKAAVAGIAMRGLSEDAAANVRGTLNAADGEQTLIQKAMDAAVANFRESQSTIDENWTTTNAERDQNISNRANARSNAADLINFVASTGSDDDLAKFAEQLAAAGDSAGADRITAEIERRQQAAEAAKKQAESDTAAKSANDAREQAKSEAEAKMKASRQTLDERAAAVGLPAGSDEKAVKEAESALPRRAEAMGLRPDADLAAVQEAEVKSLNERRNAVGRDDKIYSPSEFSQLSPDERKKTTDFFKLPENATASQVFEAAIPYFENQAKEAENAKLAERAAALGLPEQASEEVVKRAEIAKSLELPTTATDEEIRNAQRERQKQREQATESKRTRTSSRMRFPLSIKH